MRAPGTEERGNSGRWPSRARTLSIVKIRKEIFLAEEIGKYLLGNTIMIMARDCAARDRRRRSSSARFKAATESVASLMCQKCPLPWANSRGGGWDSRTVCYAAVDGGIGDKPPVKKKSEWACQRNRHGSRLSGFGKCLPVVLVEHSFPPYPPSGHWQVPSNFFQESFLRCDRMQG